MRYKFLKSKLLSVILIAVMMLSLMTVPALAAVTAQGTAKAEAGTNKIYITLTEGKFAYQNAVGLISNWSLGGASASANPISYVQRNNDTHVSVHLTNLIMTSEEYTITALAAVFNTEALPFSSPLQITVSPDVPPSFPTGYPRGGKVMYEEGSRRLDVETGLLSEPSYFYFVVVANGADAPSAEQIKAGQDSTDSPAFYSYKWDTPTISLMVNFSFPMAEDNTDYDFYLVLEDATGNETSYGPLTLTTPPERTDPICVFSGTEYTKLEEAISSAIETGGGTIKLLDDVSLFKPVVIDKSVDIVFDLNNYYFGISTGHIDDSTALTVSGGGSVTYRGSGSFNVSGAQYGVKVTGSDSSAAVTYAESTDETDNKCIAAVADNGGSVTVNGDVLKGVFGTGVHADNGGIAVVNGNVDVTGNYSTGVRASNGGSVTVNGDITVKSNDPEGGDCIGVHTQGEESKAVINGKIYVEGHYSYGVSANSLSRITVNTEDGNSITTKGDYTCGAKANSSTVIVNRGISVKGDSACGAVAYNSEGSLKVNDITAEGPWSIGADIFDFGEITVDGNVNVTGEESCGVHVYKGEGAGGTAVINGDVKSSHIGIKVVTYNVDGNVTVNGSVEAESYGLYIWHGTAHVTKNVTTTGGGSGAIVESGGLAVIDGVINVEYPSTAYVIVANSERGKEPPTSIDENGYYVYLGYNGSAVKVGNNIAPSAKAPTVVTDTVSGVTTYSAIFSGEVTSDGGSPVTEQGFVYGTDANPDVSSGITVKVSTGTSIFSAQVSGLTQDTTYHVRAYAVNDKGTAYGNGVSFKTGDTPSQPPDDSGSSGSSRVIKLPTVVTEKVSGITASDAKLLGNVTSDGGSEVTLRGFVYSTDSNPALDTGIKVNAGKGTGNFTSEITGLFSGTSYHVRAYAVNKKGTSYGEDVLFTTAVPSLGEAGYLDASGAQSPYGCVVLYTDLEGMKQIVGLSDIEGDMMKYISRGPGKYEIIFNAKPFGDIAGHWAKNDIDYCSARLLFDGVSPGIFAPDIPVTRGMLTAVLGRMYGVDASLYSGHSFDDVHEEMYYAPYIKWAAKNSIIYGMSEKIFEPERPVTRQEMASMLHRFMKFLGTNTEKGGKMFEDDNLIQDWARESVLSLQASGIINGKPNNLFEPASYTTRAETAAMLRRVIEYVLK